MTPPDSGRARCPRCSAVLVRLGSHRQEKPDAAAVLVVHHLCPGCGRRWLEHSERGWSETKVDLRGD